MFLTGYRTHGISKSVYRRTEICAGRALDSFVAGASSARVMPCARIACPLIASTYVTTLSIPAFSSTEL